MKNLNVIANGLKSISNAEASAIIEELQTPEKIMCISAVHIDEFGKEDSYEYSWQVPEYLWAEIQEKDFVEVENCGDVATVKVKCIYWDDPEDASHHLQVRKVDHLRLQKPVIYLEGMKPVFCWYQKDVPKQAILYTSIKEVIKVYYKAAHGNVLSLYGFYLITGACLTGCLQFLNKHASWLGYQACYEIQDSTSWEEAMDETDFIHKPFNFTCEFMGKIQEAGYLR
jgi:hypothetical protein